MPADETLRGGVHCCAVERFRDAPGPPPLKCEIGATIDDAIEVMALDGGKARIKGWLDLFYRNDGDGMRAKMRIQRIAYRVRFPVLFHVHVTHLSYRVHAGVGAAGTMDAHFLAAETRCVERELALHRGAILLNLPAYERGTVVLDRELVAGHGTYSNLVPGRTELPRANSPAFMARRPARCSSRMRTAPCPHATVRPSSTTVPGAPEPSPRVDRSTLI